MIAAPLAEAFAGFTAERLPAATRAHAAGVYADTVACMVAGLTDPEVAVFAKRFAGHGVTEPLTGLKAAYGNLALVLGFAATALELDDGHYDTGSHPAAHAAAGALAVAAHLGADDAARFDAFLVGYEVGARVGAGTSLRADAHGHGTWGAIGAAAAAAHLTRRDPAAFAAILDMAGGLGLATSVTAPMKGGTIRSAWVGVAARNGLLALDLFDAGVTPEPGGIEAVFGKVIGSAFDARAAAAGLGERWLIANNFMKVDASCRETQGALAAFRAAWPAGRPAGDIARVEIETFVPAADLAEREPVNIMGARFSIPATLALAAHGWQITADGYARALKDPAALDLMRRVTVVADPAMTAALPVRRTRATVHLVDGGHLAATVDGAPGDADQPLEADALRAKFGALFAEAGRTDAAEMYARLTAAA
ncbi:MmgE/PrpD family protein [Acuticoccus sp. I52.16.1]|uniref:MmgE/PrpD family protein n=1 Tax=Acuticoccus sp. I52.16.1 TaxID=2928472 RepID=UPI001FD13D07|nr:MmgE/PrpD family protein [Acuticoccus sp. I52.16.1]UOM35516.1 MmgE/PrpD family protein [Acuticoccus sp. I52.16.1]